MQLFISVLRPLEEASEARDLIIVVPEDAVVGDLAAALDRAPPARRGSPSAWWSAPANRSMPRHRRYGTVPVASTRRPPSARARSAMACCWGWARLCSTTSSRSASSSCASSQDAGPARSTA